MNSQAEHYYLKAKDDYPYNLEETKESLDYALSYDENHIGALHLMGKMYLEQLKNCPAGQHYLEEALCRDTDNANIGIDLILCYIEQYKLDRAQKLIDHLNVVAKDSICGLRLMEAYVYERKNQYSYAIKLIESAKIESYNANYSNFLDDQIKRIRKKSKLYHKMRKMEN